jgi:hypothetical protein
MRSKKRRLIAVENTDAEVPTFKRTTPRWTNHASKSQDSENFPHADQHLPSRYRLKREKDDLSVGDRVTGQFVTPNRALVDSYLVKVMHIP